MAEGFSFSVKEKDSNHLSPLEEQCLKQQEEHGDVEQDLVIEKELAAQKLWQTFQESATAVAHLFRDCQQRAGLSVWVPFHESASAVTQLYRESADVCRQCVDSGIRYGHRRRNKDVLAWAKKKKRYIKREELIAFLSDKPEPSIPQPDPEDDQNLSPIANTSATSPMSCFSNTIGSPRRRLLCPREDHTPSPLLSEPDILGQRDTSRKRGNNFSFDMSGVNDSLGAAVSSNSTTCTEFGPLMKRIKL